jgi:phosphoesterase RecJ-like protein
MIEYRHEGLVKFSFRSKGDVAVNTFAKTYFDGGGHLNAAGGISKRSLAQTKPFLVESLRAYFG